MPPYFVKIIPVLVMFFLGYFGKKIKIFAVKDADRFLQLVLNISLPALTIISLADLELNLQLIYLILIPIIMVLFTFLISNYMVSKLSVSQATKGSFMIGSLIINTGFVSTFIYAFYGKSAFGYYSLFDLGNSLMIYLFAYYQAIRYNSSKQKGLPIKKMLSLPPIWAIVIGLIINIFSLKLNEVHYDILNYVASPTMPLIILSLGIYFHPKIKRIKLALGAITLRMGLGLVFALLVIKILDLKMPLSHIVLLCSSAPIGFNTLIFSELENLDREFSATIVSFSLIISLIFIAGYSYFLR